MSNLQEPQVKPQRGNQLQTVPRTPRGQGTRLMDELSMDMTLTMRRADLEKERSLSIRPQERTHT